MFKVKVKPQKTAKNRIFKVKFERTLPFYEYTKRFNLNQTEPIKIVSEICTKDEDLVESSSKQIYERNSETNMDRHQSFWGETLTQGGGDPEFPKKSGILSH